MKHDGGLYKRDGSKVWWMRYRRTRSSIRERANLTLTEDWGEAQMRLRERLQAPDNNTLSALLPWARSRVWGMGGFLSGEFLQAAVSCAEDPTGSIERALKHLRTMFLRKPNSPN